MTEFSLKAQSSVLGCTHRDCLTLDGDPKGKPESEWEVEEVGMRRQIGSRKTCG